jgi:hypothetical protein
MGDARLTVIRVGYSLGNIERIVVGVALDKCDLDQQDLGYFWLSRNDGGHFRRIARHSP